MNKLRNVAMITMAVGIVGLLISAILFAFACMFTECFLALLVAIKLIERRYLNEDSKK